MRSHLAALAFLVGVYGIVAGAGLPHARAQATPPASFADLAARLLPAVVNVSTTQTITADKGRPDSEAPGPDIPDVPPGSPFEDFFKNFLDRQHQGEAAPPRHATSLGSGFIIDPSGLIVTNNHVIEGADEIKVTLQGDITLPAVLVGRDTKVDIALLRIKTDHKLPAVTFGASDKVRVGDWVMAIGNPFGLGGTVTVGILSARARDINAGPYDDFLQTDASINKGNSGGPMFNLDGEVIGINTAIYSPSGGSVGIGFAIPSDLARSVVAQLQQFGHTRRGWLGVRIQNVTPDVADSLQLPAASGALVASVSPKGPADLAGIRPGDVIQTFDGRPVGESRRLPRIVAETGVDRTVPVILWRAGKPLTLPVKVGELEEAEEDGRVAALTGDQPAAAVVDVEGLKLTAITPDLRKQFDLSDQAKGVVVTAVAADSAASERGLKAGDVIVEINQEEVHAPADIKAKIKSARDGGRKSVLMLIDHQGDLRFVALTLG